VHKRACLWTMVRKKKTQIVKSRGEVKTQGMTIKEWQRTPKQLLMEYCQGQKRPRPLYKRCKADPGKFRTLVVLPDPKKKTEKDVLIRTAESYDAQVDSEHASALLCLKHMDGDRQHDRRLPEPFRTAWLELGGGGGADTASSKTSKRGKKEAAQVETFDCEYCDKKFKKEHGLADHVKREHQADIAAAAAAAALAEAEGTEQDEGEEEEDSLFNFGRTSQATEESTPPPHLRISQYLQGTVSRQSMTGVGITKPGMKQGGLVLRNAMRISEAIRMQLFL